PLTDKSSPEEIKELLGISKGQFKRAVGHLLKARLVSQVNGRLILIKEAPVNE
ncbi:MAG: DNA-binding protein, partial [Limosilactobacillus fermentum]|nr:DNA-binding protein [Limosilactobacillus fermentum]